LGLASQLKVLSALLFVIGGSATLIVTFLRQRNRQLSHRRFKLGTLCCLERPFFDFCRDRLGIHGFSATYILAGAAKSLIGTVGTVRCG